MVESLKVNLPDPEHSHWSPIDHRFVTHSHPHAGAHIHEQYGPRVITKNVPGNYSPEAAR